jgi:glucosamine--fructose-6-phosphate aminotransferase (isomerizing)
VVIGRGFNYSTAYEISLKMEETSYVLAEPYSSAELFHGPVAVLEPGFPVVLVAPSGRAAADVGPLCDRLEQEGVRLVAISDLASVLRRAHAPFALPARVPEWLSPIVAVVPGQLFAVALSTARGRDPDRPRGLSKVTRTR